MDTTVQMIDNQPIHLGFLQKLRLFAACVLAVLFMRTVGWMVAAPTDPHEAVTMLLPQQGGWGGLVSTLPMMLLLTLVMTALGAMIVGRDVPQGGVFVAGVGLTALALSGGSMQTMLAYYVESVAATPDELLAAQVADRQALMAGFAMDTVAWAAVMGVAWVLAIMLHRWLWSQEDESAPPVKPRSGKDVVVKPGWQALVITAVVAALVIWITIARTPVANTLRGQVIASVAAGLFLGALAGRHFTNVDDTRWYVAAPLLVALVAYLLGYMSASMQWLDRADQYYAMLPITSPHGLVRPLPIEYIGVGVCGALAGCWTGRHPEIEE